MSTVMDLDYLSTKENIDLSFNNLDDSNVDVLVEALEKSDVIKELNLWSNRIALKDDKLCDALATNTSLRVISLGSNAIGPEGCQRLAKALKANTSLQEIHLGANSIGDEGAKALGDALKVNSSLRMLSLYENDVGDDGAKGLAEGFARNRGLKVVWLHHNKIADVGAEAMAEGLRSNATVETLFLLDNRGISKRVEKEVQVVLGDLKKRKEESPANLATRAVIHSVVEEESALLAQKEGALAARDAEIAQLKEDLLAKEEAIRAKDEEIEALQAALAASRGTPEPTAPTPTGEDTGASVKLAQLKQPAVEDSRDECHDHADLLVAAPSSE